MFYSHTTIKTTDEFRDVSDGSGRGWKAWSVHGKQTWIWIPCVNSAVLFLSCPRSEGWPHHGRIFSICLYPLSFWL